MCVCVRVLYTIQYKNEYYYSGINPIEFRGHSFCMYIFFHVHEQKHLKVDTYKFITKFISHKKNNNTRIEWNQLNQESRGDPTAVLQYFNKYRHSFVQRVKKTNEKKHLYNK